MYSPHLYIQYLHEEANGEERHSLSAGCGSSRGSCDHGRMHVRPDPQRPSRPMHPLPFLQRRQPRLRPRLLPPQRRRRPPRRPQLQHLRRRRRQLLSLLQPARPFPLPHRHLGPRRRRPRRPRQRRPPTRRPRPTTLPVWSTRAPMGWKAKTPPGTRRRSSTGSRWSCPTSMPPPSRAGSSTSQSSRRTYCWAGAAYGTTTHTRKSDTSSRSRRRWPVELRRSKRSARRTRRSA